MAEERPSLAAIGASRTVQTMVIDTLRAAITQGELLPGTKLDQQHIAEQLKVSRMPVRQALLALEAEGLVVSLPYRTAHVAEFTPEEIDELFAIRALLESAAMRLAVPMLTAHDLQQAAQIHTQMAALVQNDRSWAQLNQDFHLALYRPCGRHKLLGLIEDFRIKTLPYIRAKLALNTDVVQTSQQEHADILSACRAGDAALAAAHVRRHILSVGRLLVHTYRDTSTAPSAELMSELLAAWM